MKNIFSNVENEIDTSENHNDGQQFNIIDRMNYYKTR